MHSFLGLLLRGGGEHLLQEQNEPHLPLSILFYEDVQVAALGLLDVSFILLGTTVVLAFSDWILLVVIRAFEFTFTCELLNPLVPTYEPVCIFRIDKNEN